MGLALGVQGQVSGDTSGKQPWIDLRLLIRNIISVNCVSCLAGLSGIGADPITLLCIGGLTFAVLVAVQFLLELTSRKEKPMNKCTGKTNANGTGVKTALLLSLQAVGAQLVPSVVLLG